MTTREKLQEKGINLNTLLGIIVSGVLFLAPLKTLPIAVERISEAQSKTSSAALKMEWDIANIKFTQITDRTEVLRQIENIEKRMQSRDELADIDRSEIAKIKTEIALIKQKLSLN